MSLDTSPSSTIYTLSSQSIGTTHIPNELLSDIKDLAPLLNDIAPKYCKDDVCSWLNVILSSCMQHTFLSNSFRDCITAKTINDFQQEQLLVFKQTYFNMEMKSKYLNEQFALWLNSVSLLESNLQDCGMQYKITDDKHDMLYYEDMDKLMSIYIFEDDIQDNLNDLMRSQYTKLQYKGKDILNIFCLFDLNMSQLQAIYFIHCSNTTNKQAINIGKKRTYSTFISTHLKNAAKQLMLNTVPINMPCREQEHDEIFQYLKDGITSNGQNNGLIITGLPGTGKTAMINQISNELNLLTIENQLEPFKFQIINVMNLHTPQHIYTELYKVFVQNKTKSPPTALKKLNEFFTKCNLEQTHIIVLDELDFMLNKTQNELYNVFNWPWTIQGIIVVGIANTINIRSKFHKRVSSRMCTKTIIFKTYTAEQITQIVKHRLKTCDVFSSDAIEWNAKYISGKNGDLRTCLSLCSRAVSLADNELQNECKGHGMVNIQHLKQAKKEFEERIEVQIVLGFALYPKLFLTAIVLYNWRNRCFEAPTSTYRNKFNIILERFTGYNKLNRIEFTNILSKLENTGVIVLDIQKKNTNNIIKCGYTIC
eukprot:45857_1